MRTARPACIAGRAVPVLQSRPRARTRHGAEAGLAPDACYSSGLASLTVTEISRPLGAL